MASMTVSDAPVAFPRCWTAAAKVTAGWKAYLRPLVHQSFILEEWMDGWMSG